MIACYPKACVKILLEFRNLEKFRVQLEICRGEQLLRRHASSAGDSSCANDKWVAAGLALLPLLQTTAATVAIIIEFVVEPFNFL